MRERLEERLRGAAVAEHDRPLALEPFEDRRIGAASLHVPVPHEQRVHGGLLGAAQQGDGELVRRRHVRADEPERGQALDGAGEPLRRRRQRHIGPVEAELRERGVVHPGRERVLDRPAEDAHEARGSADARHGGSIASASTT